MSKDIFKSALISTCAGGRSTEKKGMCEMMDYDFTSPFFTESRRQTVSKEVGLL